MKYPLDPVVGDLGDGSNYYTDADGRLRCKAIKCPFCDTDLWIEAKGKDFFLIICPSGHYQHILKG